MQVTTVEYIDDQQSVRIGSEKIVTDHHTALKSSENNPRGGSAWRLRRETLALYNKDDSYVNEVEAIFCELVDEYVPEEKNYYERQDYRDFSEAYAPVKVCLVNDIIDKDHVPDSLTPSDESE